MGATLRNHDLVTPPALASTCANDVTVTGLVPMVKLLVLLPRVDDHGGRKVNDGRGCRSSG